MPPKKSDPREAEAALSPAPHPLPASGGCYEFIDGVLKLVEAPTRDPRDRPEDPVEGAVK